MCVCCVCVCVCVLVPGACLLYVYVCVAGVSLLGLHLRLQASQLLTADKRLAGWFFPAILEKEVN